MSAPSTFGQQISQKRKQLEMSQKELASKVKREDGESISPQYLNDIEHDRRSPSSDLMVRQFATVLDLNPDYLFYLAGKFPTDVTERNLPAERVQKALVAFRRALEK
jgi:transcriptional regulator with XRE-family HTH domain